MKQSKLIVFITLYFLSTYLHSLKTSTLIPQKDFNCQLKFLVKVVACLAYNVSNLNLSLFNRVANRLEIKGECKYVMQIKWLQR